MPTVPAVVPAVNVSEAPLPLIEPSVVLVSAHAYVMVPGQVELHVGVAVNGCDPLAATEGSVGLKATELRVTEETVTVMMADASRVIPL
jgi:F420-0:gamma-glutamyl ligase